MADFGDSTWLLSPMDSKGSEETRLCQSHMEGRTEVRPDHSLALECPSPSPEWLKEKSKSESMQHLSRGQLTCFWWYSDKGSYLVGLLLSFTCICDISTYSQWMSWIWLLLSPMLWVLLVALNSHYYDIQSTMPRWNEFFRNTFAKIQFYFS